MRIWSLQGKIQEADLQGHTDSISLLVVTSDSKYIVSCDDKTVRIWNLQSKIQESVLQNHANFGTSCAITSSNRYIAFGGTDKIVRIWKLFL